MSSNTKYCQVTFDDGSYTNLELSEFHKLMRACERYASTGEERVFFSTETSGSHIFFYVSKVQDVITSTPGIRKTRLELIDAIEEEERQHKETPPWL